jgi:hypothetical protein
MESARVMTVGRGGLLADINLDVTLHLGFIKNVDLLSRGLATSLIDVISFIL